MDKLTPIEAAKILGYHVKHVYRLLHHGRIKAEHWQDTYMIDRAEVERVRLLKERGNGRIIW